MDRQGVGWLPTSLAFIVIPCSATSAPGNGPLRAHAKCPNMTELPHLSGRMQIRENPFTLPFQISIHLSSFREEHAQSRSRANSWLSAGNRGLGYPRVDPG